MRNNTRSGVLALGVLTLAFAAPANAISIGGTEFVLFANTRIALESAATNINGNVAVNGAAGVLDIGSNVRIAGRAIANRINAGTGALIDTCEFNVKTGPGVCSAEVSPAGVPLSAWPPLPIAAVPACVDSAPNVTVAPGATLNLAPGCYGLVTVNDGGQLILSAGGYDVLDLQLEDGATIDGAGPAATTLSSKRVMTFKPNVIVTDIRIQTPLGMPGFASAEAIQVGNNNQVTNSLLYAPFARIHLHTGTIGTGSEAVANTLVIVLAQLPVARLSQGRSRMRTLALMGVVWAVAWSIVPIAGMALSGTSAALLLGFAVCIFAADSRSAFSIAEISPLSQGVTVRSRGSGAETPAT